MPEVLDKRPPVHVCTVHRIARRMRLWSRAVYAKAMEKRHELKLIESDDCPYCLAVARQSLNALLDRKPCPWQTLRKSFTGASANATPAA